MEHIGPETLVCADVGEERLVAKAPADWEGQVGQPVSLTLGERGVHLFRDGVRVG